MKSFNRAISKLLLVATTILCSTQYVEANTRTKEITLNYFNKEFLDKCGVVNSPIEGAIDNDDFGKIFYPLGATGNDRQYITYDGNYCYDIHYIINNKVIKEDDNHVIKFPEGGGVQ